MRGVCETRAAMLLLACAAIEFGHVDAQHRSLFQSVTNSSNGTTTLFFAATSSAFNPTSSSTTPTPTTTVPAVQTTTATDSGGGGVVVVDATTTSVAPATMTTTSMNMDANTSAVTTAPSIAAPTTTPSFATPINVTVGVTPIQTVRVTEPVFFDLPADTTKEFSMDFPNTSAYFGVGVVIPAGAWPAGETRRPSMSIFRFASPPDMPAGAKVAGDMVDFGPEGITFNSPVAITVPLNATVAGKEYTVRKYDSSVEGSWILKMGDRPAIRGGATSSNRITGETLSFSPYGAVEVDIPAQPPADTTTPVSEEEEEKGGGRKCNGGCVAGAVIGTLVGVGLLGGGGYFAYMKREEWMPMLMGKGGDDDDEPPIQRQDARRGDDHNDDDDGDGPRTNV